MADIGLIQGIAQGLRGGIEGYTAQREYERQKAKDAEDRAQRKKEYSMGLLARGFQEDPEKGLVKTEETVAKEQEESRLKELGFQEKAAEKGLLIERDDKNRIVGFKRDPNAPVDPDKQLARALHLAQLKEFGNKATEREFEKSAPGRLQKAGTDTKQKIGFLTSGLTALTNYQREVKKGGEQGYITPESPLIGRAVTSTPIDEARTSIEESIGRLASGGAINQNEEERFRRMIPTAADYRDPKIVQRKLSNLRKEMETKLIAYGFQPSDLGQLGYNPESLGYGQNLQLAEQPRRKTMQDGLINESQAQSMRREDITPDVVNYANKHGITLMEALQVKKVRTSAQ